MTQRQAIHLKAREFMAKGCYIEAVDNLSFGLAAFGSHVLLLGDLIACHSLLGRSQDVESLVIRLQSELTSASDLINSNTFYKASLFLGKMYEELGQLHEAFDLYSRLAFELHPSNEIYYNIHAQILRLGTYLKKSGDPSYSICLNAKLNSSNLRFENLHALLCGELYRGQTDLSLKRLVDIFNTDGILQADLRLVLIDFLEILLSNKKELSIDQKNAVDVFIKQIDWNEADIYEQYIIRFYGKDRVDLVEILKSKSNLSTMSMIRLLTLLIVCEPLESSRAEIQVSLRSILSPLSEKNQRLHFARIIRYLSQFELTNHFQSVDNILTEDQEKFLHLIIKYNSMNTEDLIRKLYDLDFSSSTYDRLRKLVSRINFICMQHFIGVNVFQVTKEQCLGRQS